MPAVLAHAWTNALRCAPRHRPRIWGTWTRNLSAVFPAAPLGGGAVLLPLRVLRGLAGALQAVLLALLHAGVARQESGLLEGRAQLLVRVEQRPGDAVGDGAGLSGHPPAQHLDADVEPAERVRQPQRLQHDLLQPALAEVL